MVPSPPFFVFGAGVLAVGVSLTAAGAMTVPSVPLVEGVAIPVAVAPVAGGIALAVTAGLAVGFTPPPGVSTAGLLATTLRLADATLALSIASMTSSVARALSSSAMLGASSVNCALAEFLLIKLMTLAEGSPS